MKSAAKSIIVSLIIMLSPAIPLSAAPLIDYQASNQVCAEGKYKLSPDGSLIAREVLFDSTNLGRGRNEYSVEIINSKTHEIVLAPLESISNFSWSLDGKAFYKENFGTLTQLDVTPTAFSYLASNAKPFSVGEPSLSNSAPSNFGLIDNLFSDLGYIPLTTFSAGLSGRYLANLELNEGSYQLNEPGKQIRFIQSDKKAIYSGEEKTLKWWVDSFGAPVARLTLENKNPQGFFTSARLSSLSISLGKLESRTQLEFPINALIDRENSSGGSHIGFDLFLTFANERLTHSNNSAWSSNSLSTNTRALYETHLENIQQQKLLYMDPKFDIERPIFTRRGELAGAEIYRETRTFVPLSPLGQKIKQHIIAISPKKIPVDINIHSLSDDGKFAIIGVAGNNQNATYYVDIEKNIRKKIPTSCINTTYLTYPLWHKAADGTNILSYYSQPDTANNSTPLVVEIHGGPYLRENLNPNNESHFFLRAGYSVLRVNFRGSSGFGKDFSNALTGNANTMATEDIVGALENLLKEKKLNPKIIIAYGASFGGYQVLNIAASEKSSRRFDKFVAVNPVVDLKDFELTRKPFPVNVLSDEQRKAKNSLEFSPIRHQKPILIAWGSKDININPIRHSKEFIKHYPQANIDTLELNESGHELSPDDGILLNKKIISDSSLPMAHHE